MSLRLALAWFLAVAAVSGAAAKDSSGYFNGRATFYTDNQQGSCHLGAPPDVYYAAWPDTMEGFPQCGNCFEVSCVNKDFTDGYGQAVRRSSACHDEHKTIVVKIIDSCPCVHENFLSNQRWCCGDSEHLDLSHDVFKMLADEHNGVIGLKWRPTSCDHLGATGGTAPDKGKGSSSSSGRKRKASTGTKKSKAGSTTSSLEDFMSSIELNFDPDVEDGQLVLTQQQWDDLVAKSGSSTQQYKWEKPSWLRLSSGWRR